MSNMSLRYTYRNKLLALIVCLSGIQLTMNCSNQQRMVLDFQRKLICEAFDKASVGLLPINLLEVIKAYIGSTQKEWYTAKGNCYASVVRNGEQSIVRLLSATGLSRELPIPYVVKALTISPEEHYLFLIGQQTEAQRRKLMIRTISLLTMLPNNYRYIEGWLDNQPSTYKFFVDSFFTYEGGKLSCKYSRYQDKAKLAKDIADDSFILTASAPGSELNWKKAKKFKFPRTEQQKQQDCIIS